jgi:hypothetical protein
MVDAPRCLVVRHHRQQVGARGRIDSLVPQLREIGAAFLEFGWRCCSDSKIMLFGNAVMRLDQRVNFRCSSHGTSNSVASICVVSSIDTRSTKSNVSSRAACRAHCRLRRRRWVTAPCSRRRLSFVYHSGASMNGNGRTHGLWHNCPRWLIAMMSCQSSSSIFQQRLQALDGGVCNDNVDLPVGAVHVIGRPTQGGNIADIRRDRLTAASVRLIYFTVSDRSSVVAGRASESWADRTGNVQDDYVAPLAAISTAIARPMPRAPPVSAASCRCG